jgi:hypothetical protein
MPESYGGTILMGLDMYLSKKETSEVAYWRKANAIHGWFVNNAREVDEDILYVVSMDNIITLRNICAEITLEHDEDKAMELLPPASGFFFGSDVITDYYWDYVSEAVTTLTAIISENPDDTEFEYYASW